MGRLHGLLKCLLLVSLLSLATCQNTTTPPVEEEVTPAPVAPDDEAAATVSPQPSRPPAATLLPTTQEVPVPTVTPTVSPMPSPVPSVGPTVSPAPTEEPTRSPAPSSMPSWAPTGEPTFSEEIVAAAVFNQRFQIGTQSEFNETERQLFCGNMESYTGAFGGRADEKVNTTCSVLRQRLQIIGTVGQRRELRENDDDDYFPDDDYTTTSNEDDSTSSTSRRLQVTFNQVEYEMSYRSRYENVTSYPSRFQSYVNEDLQRLTDDLQSVGLDVTNSFLAFNNLQTPAPSMLPTVTPMPTQTPSVEVRSEAPTITGVPTITATPTQLTPVPSIEPEFSRDPAIPIVTSAPTIPPSSDGGSTEAPNQDAPTTGGSPSTTNTVAITVSVVVALVCAMGVLFFWRRRRKKQELQSQREAAGKRLTGTTGATSGQNDNGGLYVGAKGNMRIDTSDVYNQNSSGKKEIAGMISPADSVLTNESLLSYGPSPLSEGSQPEQDRTHNLADEFDQYKDQNLEKMRTGVEGNLSGFDGMMSQALTKALMDDDSDAVDIDELQWGGTGDATEIEATALCEVTDWLKRKEGATMEEKGTFMQEILNKMVASVRHGVMDADLGTRVIHECAALLGLQLACDIPGNALIVTGMPKWVTRSDVISAFSEFGEIENAAVSSNRRGFGLVRFKSLKSIERALTRFRTSEIEVKDVAVNVKVLKSDGDSDRRPPPSPWDRGYPPPPASRHSSRQSNGDSPPEVEA